MQKIQSEEQVQILYACESGSRAWGFSSATSDYDVRFIYLHPQNWYLSIDLESKRDVIERTIDEQLDLQGWDLRKTLYLLRKGNPYLSEWLGSPIVYWEKSPVAEQMRHLINQYSSPVTCAYYYFHMAKNNYRSYLKGPIVWRKKYFYVLRPLLAIRWLEQGRGVVPAQLQTLVEQTVESPELKKEIEKLLAAKRQGEELGREPRIDTISNFIEEEMVRLSSKQFEKEYRDRKGPISEFNRVFQEALQQISWH